MVVVAAVVVVVTLRVEVHKGMSSRSSLQLRVLLGLMGRRAVGGAAAAWEHPALVLMR